MNLQQTVDILAGGPGSGCNGPNCGRPLGHGGAHGKARVGGKFTKQQKMLMRQKGMLKKAAGKVQPFPTKLSSRHIAKTQVVAMPKSATSHKKYETFTFTELKPVGKNDSQGTRRWSSEPPLNAHLDIGRFHEEMKADIPGENRRFFAFTSTNSDEGHGTSVFVNKERTGPNSSKVMLQEVYRDRFHEIVGTKTVHFKSGRQARDFLKYRYGLEIKWTQ